MRKYKNIKLYLPESFEWIILKSGLIEGKKLKEILEKPEEYIDSREFFELGEIFHETADEYNAGDVPEI